MTSLDLLPCRAPSGRRNACAVAALLLLGPLAAGCWQESTSKTPASDPVVARVNGVAITQGDLALAEEDVGAEMQGATPEAKREQLIKQAFEIGIKDYGYIPLHQQALAWGVSNKVKLTQRADNQVLLYWATKQEE